MAAEMMLDEGPFGPRQLKPSWLVVDTKVMAVDRWSNLLVTPLAGNITSQTCTHTCIDNHNLITCGRHGYTAKNHTI